MVIGVWLCFFFRISVCRLRKILFRRGAGVAERGSLENCCSASRDRGFESLPLRQSKVPGALHQVFYFLRTVTCEAFIRNLKNKKMRPKVAGIFLLSPSPSGDQYPYLPEELPSLSTS